MAGWLVVWSSGGAGVDPARWDRAVAAAARHGARAEGWEGGSCRLAAWRRDAAEFPRSGRLVRPSPGVVVAWVGQCLEDQGDVSDRGVTAVGGNADAGTLAGLNGPFAAAIVRDDRGRRGDRPQPMGGPAVRIVLDRHRHYPVYLHRGIAVTVASTELACVIPWIAEPRISREAS
ncbi:MAG TPA: hypothetical protein VD963_00140, partial [Phycisphaerales bacterium]|nr:hypothetical protein [Phycisphaerales bacterium]